MERTAKHFRKRDAILSYLRSTDVHPSADMVYAHLKPEIPDLSLGTVYRNLSMFRQQGTIASVGTVNGVERFDGNTNPQNLHLLKCITSPHSFAILLLYYIKYSFK